MNCELLVPEGFKEISITGGYFASLAPIYTKLDNGVPLTAFRVQKGQSNPMNVCHGGAIACLADLQALGAQQLAGLDDHYTPTINLSVDYIRPARLGAWVEMRTSLLRATAHVLFSHAIITADGELVARSSGIFKVSRAHHLEKANKDSIYQ